MGLGAMPVEFLRSWIATNVRPVPPAERRAQVAKWAARCIGDACTAGIPYDDLYKAAGGNVITLIARGRRTTLLRG